MKEGGVGIGLKRGGLDTTRKRTILKIGVSKRNAIRAGA